ncbi:MAG TPA: hypothetical protein VHG53_05740 [Candidatus Limnocylindria bacterium]|nr:hypothetical protein [Candidatus Limnocylindria bacterium]
MRYGNAVVVQSDDPRELLAHLATLGARVELAERIRSDGQATARRFAWPRIIDAMEVAWESAATRA